ncbi:hypothetical protein D083_3043 [Dickeya solani RNS 08.23.3.1.A]|nr:hypothetical protein D083_3043 [Dickeya solani RNS 08.23.3.1.A]
MPAGFRAAAALSGVRFDALIGYLILFRIFVLFFTLSFIKNKNG